MRALFLFFLLVIATCYYAFTAVATGLSAIPYPFRLYTQIAVGLFGLFAIVTPFLYNRWASKWPSKLAMHIVHTGITVLIGFVLMAAAMLLADMVTLAAALVKSVSGSTSFTFVRSPVVGLLVIVAGILLTFGLVYGVFRRYRYRVRNVQVAISGLPKSFHGFRIVQLSDIHSGSFDNPDAVTRGVDQAMALRPDLIVFTGDLVNHHAEEFKPYLEIFSRLRARHGVYSVLGNHDYGDYIRWPSSDAKRQNLQNLMRYQGQAGWRLLMNESVEIQQDGEALTLIGVENWSLRSNFPRHGRLKEALEGVPADRPAILLSHDPSHWVAEVAKSHPHIVLTLSGHTHGMQFGFESRWLRWSPAQYLYKEWAGLYQRDGQYLYVNRGFGFIGYLGRLGMAPEITLLELVEKS